MDIHDLVSIVVIGRNEGPRLQRCLASINAITHPTFSIEVIYVDSGSTDNSLAIANAARVQQTIELHPERPSAALARNAGWLAAHGNIIMFLDGDTILHPDFIANSLPDLSPKTDQAIAIIWGHRREIHPEQSIYNRVFDLDWIFAPGLVTYCGGDALFLRSALAQVDGFDETLIAGEEPELCRRIAAHGHKILHVDRPMTGHDLAITRFSQYWRRNTRAGHAYAEVSALLATRGEAFWVHEAKANRNRAITFLLLTAYFIIHSILRRSFVPISTYILFLLLISIRSAYKARWKSSNKLTLFLYGIHSHFAQIPIYIGQLQFKRNRRSGQRAKLLEYKQP